MGELPELKTFDARVIGSITSGILLIEDFSKVHDAIEWIAGYPVWTHELPTACRNVCGPSIFRSHPDMPEKQDVLDWEETAAALVARYPDGIEVPRGSGERLDDPISTLVEMMDRRAPIDTGKETAA